MKCLKPLTRFTIAAICLAELLIVPASAQQVDTSENVASGAGQSNTRPLSSSGKYAEGGQPPLLIIKKNTEVTTTTKGWAVGIQNEATQMQVLGAGIFQASCRLNS